jgi:hypothetical protein
MFDVHPFFEQPFFQIICLFLHLFPFNVRCSFFLIPPGQKQLCAYGACRNRLWAIHWIAATGARVVIAGWSSSNSPI